MSQLVGILLLMGCAAAIAAGMFVVGQVLGPRRKTAVKQMPYESGMNPIHDTRRRFDFRFHAVAIAFLVFDVEILFLYPWAVANKDPAGLARAAESAATRGFSPALVLGEVLVFMALLAVGYVYAWRRGVFQWR